MPGHLGICYKSVSWILIILISLSMGGQDLINPPKSGEKDTSSKEEKGILSTLILMYTKTRNAVKYAYDEIQYWKSMKQTYDKMKMWFDRNGEKINQIASTAKKITTQKENVFEKLRRAESLFDQVEDVAFRESREFDRLITYMENDWDSLASHASRTKRFLPDVAQVLGVIEGIAGKTPSSKEVSDTIGVPEQEIKYILPEQPLVASSKYIAASTIASSEYYQGWSAHALENIDSIDQKFRGFNSVNQKEMQAAWYEIEQANANNNRISHSLQELKTYIAVLGVDVWKTSEERGNELQSSYINKEKSEHIISLRNREDEEYFNKYGVRRPGSNR